jgi:acyl-coenzyme A thioesterase PaaI-like protein
MATHIPVQDRLHKNNPIRRCFGCGADNHGGLRLKSFTQGDLLTAHWKPDEHHQAYPGYLNGGIACTLIDCHAAWAAFARECEQRGLDPTASPDSLPAGWTKALSVEFLRPTPLHTEVELRARVIRSGTTSRTVACSLYAKGEECVRGEVTIVMTDPQ